MTQCKSICYSWSELSTDNSKIGPWSRDLPWLDVQFRVKYHFSFFRGLSATIPSTWLDFLCCEFVWKTDFTPVKAVKSTLRCETHLSGWMRLCTYLWTALNQKAQWEDLLVHLAWGVWKNACWHPGVQEKCLFDIVCPWLVWHVVQHWRSPSL